MSRVQTRRHGVQLPSRSSASVLRGIVPTSRRCRITRQHLRSATQQLLVVPRHQLSSYGPRAFYVAGPSVWNSLPDSLRNPIISGNSGVARNLIWGVYVLTSHCNFKTCVNVPHLNKTVTDFGGIYIYIPIYPPSLRP